MEPIENTNNENLQDEVVTVEPGDEVKSVEDEIKDATPVVDEENKTKSESEPETEPEEKPEESENNESGKEESGESSEDVEQEGQEEDKEENQAKVNLSATNEMNPYLLLMAHSFIRNTILITI